jgi:galactokinase
VVEENERVNRAFEALHQGDLKRLGALMFQTHNGLKDEFEVSCEELDLLVDLAKASEEVIGARMMGGGFGGCTINLVKKEATARFSERITAGYKKVTGTRPEIHIVKIADGTAEIMN